MDTPTLNESLIAILDKPVKKSNGNPEWVKGQSANPAGRPKGIPNKFTQFKHDLHWVYQKMGGKQRVYNWAIKSDENFKSFLVEYLKLVPKDQIDLTVSEKGTVNLQIIIGRDDNGDGNGHDKI